MPAKPKWRRVDSDTYRLEGTNDECMVLAGQYGGWVATIDIADGSIDVSYRHLFKGDGRNSLREAQKRAEFVYALVTQGVPE